MKKLFFIIFFTLSFLFLSHLRLALAVESYPYSQQGEVLGIKEAWRDIKNFLKDPGGNLFKWVIGGTIGPEGAEVLDEHGFLGAICYGILTQLIGIPGEIPDLPKSEEAGGGGGGSEVQGVKTINMVPSGAIIMPPGDWYFSGGALGITSNVVASLISNPPASGVYYAQNLMRDSLGIKTAYAQGGQGTFFTTRFEGILKIWKAFRDLVLTIFSLLFVILGLFIMFRVKIAPQTTATVTAILPKVIGGLILVVFSYAIAGFMFDLMYVILGVIVKLLQAQGIGGGYLPPDKSVGEMTRWGLPSELGMVFKQGVLGTIKDATFYGVGGGAIIAIISGIISSTLLALLAWVPVLLLLIFVICFLILWWRAFWALLKTYLQVVLLIIFSPFYIAAGILPNTQLGFSSWLRSLFANLMVFPAVTLFLALAAEFAKLGPQLDALAFPHIGTGGGIVGLLLAVGIVWFLPTIPDTIRSAMGVKRAADLGEIKNIIAPIIIGGRMAGGYIGVEIEKRYRGGVPGATRAMGIVNALRSVGIIK